MFDVERYTKKIRRYIETVQVRFLQLKKLKELKAKKAMMKKKEMMKRRQQGS